MRRVFAVLALAAAVSGAEDSPEERAKAIAEGRELYNRSCTMCHGLDGTAGDRAPALAANRRYLRNSEEQLFDAIKNGIGGTLMPPTPLPDAQVHKIVAYIRSLRGSAVDGVVKGDSRKGADVFWGKGKCGDCHMIRGRGGLLGPDLSNLGAERSLKRIEEALTEPRPHPSRGYVPVEVVTADGKSISGIVKNESSFSLQVLGADHRIHLLERDALQAITYPQQSLMPSDYDKRLTKDEFQNLLAFLSRQARSRETQ